MVGKPDERADHGTRRSRDDRGAPAIEPRADRAAPFLLAIAILTTAFPLVAGHNVFLRSIHFAILQTVTTIGAAGGLPAGARRRAVIRWGALGVLLMAGVRIIKTVDVVETWSASAFAELLGTHVPPGSVVVGYDEFYFYAVERGGSTFRSSRADPWDYSSASLRSAWGDRIRRPAADPDSGRFSALAG